MKILILGAYGMLGHKLFQSLNADFETYASCRSYNPRWAKLIDPSRLIYNIQADNFDSIISAMEQVNPDIVINCIGIIKQIKEAKNPIPSIYINALFPHKLAQLCKIQGSRLFHFSTDCVFSGQKGNYTEDDESDAKDLYGQTKYLGELHYDHCLTIRSSIIGWELNTQNGLVEWFVNQKNKKIKGYSKAIYTGFTTGAMANIIKMLIIDQPKLSGVVQIASDPISKYDLLNLIQDKHPLNIEIEKDEKFFCDRSLSGAKFNQTTEFEAPTWNEMIENLIKEKEYYETI